MTLTVQSNGTIHTVSPERFEELTGAKWIDEMVVSDEELHATTPSRVDCELMQLILPHYRAYRRRPPKLYMREGPSKGSHSVHALEKIEKGSVVVEYLGEWTLAERHSSYKWGPIDGANFRNFGALVEDGFPNCAPIYLYNVDHLPLRVVFVALEEIEAGEMIAINYGMNHSVKLSYHTEYRLEAMSRYFKAHPLDKVAKRIKELRNASPKELGLRRTLELESLTAKFRYLFHTPSALYALLTGGILDAALPFRYLKEAEVRYYLLNFSLRPTLREQALIAAHHLLERVVCNREWIESIPPWLLSVLPSPLPLRPAS